MKVLFYNRDPRFWIGGDMVQMQSTLEAVKKLGIDAEFNHSPNVNVKKYNLVHVFNINFEWAYKIVQKCQKEKRPYIISAIFYPTEYQGVTFDKIKEMVDGSKYTICLSSKEAAELVEKTGCNRDKIKIIPNGVNKNIFTRERNQEDRQVITVGRVENNKGQHLATRACLNLGVPFIIVGNRDGLNPELVEKYKSMNIHFIGEKTQEEIVDLLHRSSVYVCSSLSERQSLGVLEAAACGLPIVDSVFNRGASFLPSSKIVDPTNIEALTDAISSQLDAPDNQDLIPSWDDVGRKVISLYK